MRLDSESLRRRLETEEAFYHRVRHQQRLGEFHIDADAAGRPHPLHGVAVFSGRIIGPVTARCTRIRVPVEDALETLPGIVRTIDADPAHHIVETLRKDGAAVLNLPSVGEDVRLPSPVIPAFVPAGRRTRGEPPVVDVLTGAGVPFHDPPSVDPVHDRARMLRRNRAIINRLFIQEGEAVVPFVPFHILGGVETAGTFIPEPAIQRGRDPVRFPAQGARMQATAA